jgi:ribosomal-protein-alanine N-acetyltransferase
VGGILREASEADIPELVDLEAKLFDNAMSETVLRRELEVGKGFVWVGNMTPLVLGYALVREDGDLLDLTRLGVDPAEQGTGIGTLLLRRVLSEGRPVMLLVRKDNQRAFRLYRSHGFEIVGHVTAPAHAWVLRRAAGASARPAP